MIRSSALICILMAGGSCLYLYQSKQRAQMLDREIGKTIQQTEQARERIAVLKAEWAVLNAPDRLSGLADAHLSLQPLQPSQLVAEGDLASKLPAPVVPSAPTPQTDPEPQEAQAAAVAQAVPSPAPGPADAAPVTLGSPPPVAVASPAPEPPAPGPKPVRPSQPAPTPAMAPAPAPVTVASRAPEPPVAARPKPVKPSQPRSSQPRPVQTQARQRPAPSVEVAAAPPVPPRPVAATPVTRLVATRRGPGREDFVEALLRRMRANIAAEAVPPAVRRPGFMRPENDTPRVYAAPSATARLGFGEALLRGTEAEADETNPAPPPPEPDPRRPAYWAPPVYPAAPIYAGPPAYAIPRVYAPPRMAVRRSPPGPAPARPLL